MSKRNQNKTQNYVTMPDFREGVCLNNQTVGNLKKYLRKFPNDARVVITSTDSEGNYRNFDCKIACNFEHQFKTNTVQLILGFIKD